MNGKKPVLEHMYFQTLNTCKDSDMPVLYQLKHLF